MWTCKNCEQNNGDGQAYCPLCGAAKPLNRETPAYAAPKPAPTPANASGGAWGNVGDWRKKAAEDAAYDASVRAASAPSAGTGYPPAGTSYPSATAYPPTPAAAPVAAPVAGKSPANAEEIRAEKKKLRWLRVAILAAVPIFGLTYPYFMLLGDTASSVTAFCIVIPNFLLAYKNPKVWKIERWLSVGFNYLGVLYAADLFYEGLGTPAMWIALLAIALFVVRSFCHKKAILQQAKVIDLEN